MTALLKASGVEADSESLDIMMSKLEGKTIPELIKEGSKQLASMPSGGGGGAAASAPAAGGAAAEKEAAPVEEEPEEDVDMGDLFGGGDDDY